MELTAIAPELWVATQSFRFAGLEIGSRMTVIRLPSGTLLLISPIALHSRDRAQLLELGAVEFIIAPNLFHHLSVGAAQALFPHAKVLGVPGLPQKRSDLKFDGVLAQSGSFESVNYLSVQGFAAFIPPKIQLAHEVVFCHYPSRTLIIADLAFHFDQDSDRLMRVLAKVIGNYNVLRPTWLEKWGTRQKDAVETSMRQVLAWDFDRVIPGHGSIVADNGKEKLRQGYEWFLNRSL